MMTKKLFFLLLFVLPILGQSQELTTISGHFPQASNNEIFLKGFVMTADTLLTKTTADAAGNFSLSYNPNYVGAAVLEIKDKKSVIVLLHHENFRMQWDNLDDFSSLKFSQSIENESFGKGIVMAQMSENKLSGLNYLLPLYKDNPKKAQWLKTEIQEQEKAFPTFLKSLPLHTYAEYYLSLRKLIQDMPITASRYIERLPEHEKQFNSLDFADSRLLQSGLYKELLDGYFQLLESYSDLDKVYAHCNTSTDVLIKSLQKYPEMQQDVAEYLFKLFEKRSLFKAAEHLSFAMLNTASCQEDDRRGALFEQYRKMAKGNTAPDIVFENQSKAIAKLSDIKSKYKLVVFGASWCTKCTEEIPRLKPYYEDWKTKYDAEIVFVSLDTELAKFKEFTKDFSWLSSSELKGWEGKSARDYYIYGTPTMYLLDENNTILLKPISEKQVQAWFEFQKK